MLIAEIFYSTFWVSMISIIWFYTDTFLHYTQLLGIATEMRLDYMSYVIENPDRYFPNYLHEKSLECNDNVVKFLAKLISCPFCLLTWLALFASVFCSTMIIIAPVYVLSLFIVLQTKRML